MKEEELDLLNNELMELEQKVSDKKNKMMKIQQEKALKDGRAYLCIICSEYTPIGHGYDKEKICSNCHHELESKENKDEIKQLEGSLVLEFENIDSDGWTSSVIIAKDGKKYRLKPYNDNNYDDSDELFISIEEIKENKNKFKSMFGG